VTGVVEEPPQEHAVEPRGDRAHHAELELARGNDQAGVEALAIAEAGFEDAARQRRGEQRPQRRLVAERDEVAERRGQRERVRAESGDEAMGRGDAEWAGSRRKWQADRQLFRVARAPRRDADRHDRARPGASVAPSASAVRFTAQAERCGGSVEGLPQGAASSSREDEHQGDQKDDEHDDGERAGDDERAASELVVAVAVGARSARVARVKVHTRT
jgi:hypothetical protein